MVSAAYSAASRYAPGWQLRVGGLNQKRNNPAKEPAIPIAIRAAYVFTVAKATPAAGPTMKVSSVPIESKAYPVRRCWAETITPMA